MSDAKSTRMRLHRQSKSSQRSVAMTENHKKFIEYAGNEPISQSGQVVMFMLMFKDNDRFIEMNYNKLTDDIFITKTIMVDNSEPFLFELVKELAFMRILQKMCVKYVICGALLTKLHEQKNNKIKAVMHMEYFGPSLVSYINIKLSYSQIITLMYNMSLGLQYIHEMGFVHRDVKPDNIVVNTDTLDIKYIDFGSACMDPEYVPQTITNENIKLLSHKTEELSLQLSRHDMETCLHKAVGTPFFIAPELIISANDDDLKHFGIPEWKKADIWSLGVTFYELLTGTYPFTSNNKQDLLHKIVDKKNYNRVEDERFSFINQMLDKDPESRITVQKLIRLISSRINEIYSVIPLPNVPILSKSRSASIRSNMMRKTSKWALTI